MSFNNLLFIFKDRKSVTLNHDFWIDKFKIKYNVFTFFVNDKIELSNKEIISEINKFILKEKIQIVLFEGDHAHLIDDEFIEKILPNIKKGIFLGDDMVWHLVNLISAKKCDFVLTSEPISSYKFREIGIKSLFVPIEANGKIFKERNLKKIYDVLHFGRNKTIRSDYVNYLRENDIKVKSVSPYDNESDTIEKLAKLISQSKIVINFEKSLNGNRFFNPLKIFKFFYQTKGRIQMAGISNVLCISEYSPSSEILYDKVLPFFYSKEDCLNKIKFYLSNNEELMKATKAFHLKSLEYEDSRYIDIIENFINSINNKNYEDKFTSPIWYKYLFINQTFRLRFKHNYLNALIKEFFIKIFNLNNYNFSQKIILFFVINLIFLRYLPFIIVKKIINFLRGK
tara:strand:+ start:14 stop:1207 length:1194 start_codon:yes stop_codon:yes gene_type:complete